MKAYVNKTTGVVHEINLRNDAVIDADKNRVGHVTFLNGLPEGELVDFDRNEAYDAGGPPPDHDPSYQRVDITWVWDKTANTVAAQFDVSEWRTQAEAEAEAAAAALDVTPDSA